MASSQCFCAREVGTLLLSPGAVVAVCGQRPRKASGGKSALHRFTRHAARGGSGSVPGGRCGGNQPLLELPGSSMQALDVCLPLAFVTRCSPPVRSLQVFVDPGLRFDSVEARLHPLCHVPHDLPDRMTFLGIRPPELR